MSQAMGSIHGVLPGGKVITNVDVFRKLYEVVGLGWVYSITKFGPINKVANWYAQTCHGDGMCSTWLHTLALAGKCFHYCYYYVWYKLHEHEQPTTPVMAP